MTIVPFVIPFMAAWPTIFVDTSENQKQDSKDKAG